MKSKRSLFLSIALMCGFFTLAFRFDEKNIYWIWEEKIQVPIILVAMTIIFGIFWFLEKKKIKDR